MNRIFSIVFFCLLFTVTKAQAQTSFVADQMMVSSTSVSPVFRKMTPTVLRSSFRMPGEREKKIGSTMAVLGGGMLVGGIFIYSSVDEKVRTVTYTNNQGQLITSDELAPKAALEILMMVAGVGISVPGVLIWRKGVKKYNKYLIEQERLSLNFNGISGSLTYKF